MADQHSNAVPSGTPAPGARRVGRVLLLLAAAGIGPLAHVCCNLQEPARQQEAARLLTALATAWATTPSAEDVLSETVFGALFATAPLDLFATVHVGPSSGCALQVGGPVVHATVAHPIAGKPFTFDWSVETLLPVAPVQVALLVSTRPLQAPVALGPAAPGCLLWVHPDYVLVPGTLLTYTPATGLVRLAWTPPAELIGATFYTQLVVARPGANSLGHLLSAPVAFSVGSR